MVLQTVVYQSVGSYFDSRRKQVFYPLDNVFRPSLLSTLHPIPLLTTSKQNDQDEILTTSRHLVPKGNE